MSSLRTVKTTVTAILTAGMLGLFAVQSGAAAKQPAYVGVWGLDSGSCKSGDAELKITPTNWGSVDFECKVKSVSGGKGIWRVKLHKCKGDGVGKTESVTIRATAKKATTSYAGDAFSNNFVRCK